MSNHITVEQLLETIREGISYLKGNHKRFDTRPAGFRADFPGSEHGESSAYSQLLDRVATERVAELMEKARGYTVIFTYEGPPNPKNSSIRVKAFIEDFAELTLIEMFMDTYSAGGVREDCARHYERYNLDNFFLPPRE